MLEFRCKIPFLKGGVQYVRNSPLPPDQPFRFPQPAGPYNQCFPVLEEHHSSFQHTAVAWWVPPPRRPGVGRDMTSVAENVAETKRVPKKRDLVGLPNATQDAKLFWHTVRLLCVCFFFWGGKGNTKKWMGLPRKTSCFFSDAKCKGNQPQVRGYPQAIAGLTKDVKGVLLTIVPGSFSWLGPICPPITASRVVHSVLPNQWSPHIPLAVGVCGWCFWLKQLFFCEKNLPEIMSCHVPPLTFPKKKTFQNESQL